MHVHPIKKQQKGQLDDVASRALELLEPHLRDGSELHRTFGAHALGLPRDEAVTALLKYVFSEQVACSEHFMTERQSIAHLNFLYDEVDNAAGRVALDDLVRYLRNAHWRLVHRREQRAKLSWSNADETTGSQPHSQPVEAGHHEEESRPVTKARLVLDNVFAASAFEANSTVFCLKEASPRPEFLVANFESAEVQPTAARSLQRGMKEAVAEEGSDATPYPTALVAVAELECVVVATTCNTGSHLHLAAPDTGYVLHSAATDSYQTALCYDQNSGQICGGSALGEVSFFTTTHRQASSTAGERQRSNSLSLNGSQNISPTAGASTSLRSGGASLRMDVSASMSLRAPLHFEGCSRPHNGPVLAVCAMTVSAHIASVGADGKIALTDPFLMACVRTVVASPKRAVSAAAFDQMANFIVVAAGETVAHVWHGSLPTSCEPIELADAEEPHSVGIVSIAVDAPRHHVLTLDGKGTVKVWDPRLRRCLQTFGAPLTISEQRLGLWKLLTVLREGLIAVISDSSTHVFELQKEDIKGSSGSQCDVLSTFSLCTTSTNSVVVTASRQHARLYNTGSGALQQSFEGIAKTKITSCAIDETTHCVIIGEANGDVAAFDVVTALERWRHAGRHTQAVEFVRCGADIVVACGAEGVLTASRGPAHAHYRYEEKQIKAHQLMFLDAYEVFGVVTKAGSLDLFEVLQFNGAVGGASANLVKAHSYAIAEAIGAVGTAATAAPTILTFLGSIGVAAASCGSRVTIITLTTSRVARITSWEIAGGASVAFLAFLEDSGHLVVGDAAGNASVFDIAEAVRVASAPLSAAASPLAGTVSAAASVTNATNNIVAAPAVATYSFRPYPNGAVTCWLHLREFNVVVVGGDNLEAAVFRADGVRMGALDMFTADADAWRNITDPIATSLAPAFGVGGAPSGAVIGGGGDRRRSTAISLLMDRRKSSVAILDDSPLGQSMRKVIPRAKHRTTISHGALPQQRQRQPQQDGHRQGASPSPSGTGGLAPIRTTVGSGPPLHTTVDSTVHLAPSLQLLPPAPRDDGLGVPEVRPKAGERSGRTEPRHEAEDAKWTLDYVPPKERGGGGVLLALRTMTKGLNPSAELVTEFQKIAHARFVTQNGRESPFGRGAAHHLLPLGRSVSPAERLLQHSPTPSPSVPSASLLQTQAGGSLVEQAPLWMKKRPTQPPMGGGFHFIKPQHSSS